MSLGRVGQVLAMFCMVFLYYMLITKALSDVSVLLQDSLNFWPALLEQISDHLAAE